MERVYYYPPLTEKEYPNPYSNNYRAALAKRYKLANIDGAYPIGLSIGFFLSVFRADIYIINWLENISYFRYGPMQFRLVKLGLWILNKRKCKIVWMFHNIHPHQGHNASSQWLHKYMFSHASLIISHSKEATEYAKEHTDKKVICVCHPVHPIKME